MGRPGLSRRKGDNGKKIDGTKVDKSILKMVKSTNTKNKGV